MSYNATSLILTTNPGSGFFCSFSTSLVRAFLIDEMGESVSVRPALVLGVSLPSTLQSYVAAARFDTCARVPGNYTHGAGI